MGSRRFAGVLSRVILSDRRDAVRRASVSDVRKVLRVVWEKTHGED